MANRLSRLLLLVRVVIYFLLHGKANKIPNTPKKIVIVQLSKLGDMVCTTPMFNAVKKVYPESKITVVGDSTNKMLLENHNNVDRYIIWDKTNISSIIKEIREDKYDFGCCANVTFEGVAALFLAGIPLIAAPKVFNGWSPYETRPYRFLKKFVVNVPHTMGKYAPREYLKLLEPIGIMASETKKTLAHSLVAEERVKSWLSQMELIDRLLVGISVTAGNKIKEWPSERFAQVADYLIEKYNTPIILMGGPRDGERVSSVASLIKRKDRVTSTTEFNVDELKALVSSLSLFIAVDTGPIYIAEAYSVPTIDIVGPMDENEQPPISDKNIVVVPKNRVRPELHIMNARAYDVDKAVEQVLSITTEQVINAVEKLISSIKQ